MKAHILLTLLIALAFSSCASHEGRGLSSFQEQEAQQQHLSMNGNQADRFR